MAPGEERETMAAPIDIVIRWRPSLRNHKAWIYEGDMERGSGRWEGKRGGGEGRGEGPRPHTMWGDLIPFSGHCIERGLFF